MKFKKINFCFLFSLLFCLSVSVKNINAWYDETHRDMIRYSVDILKNDNKTEAYNLFSKSEHLSKLLLGCLAPDNKGDRDNTPIWGWHHYVSRNSNTGVLLPVTKTGKYFKNGSGGYLKSARTLFEENYTIALTLYKTYEETKNQDYLLESMYFLGRSMHGVCDMSSSPHSLGIFRGISSDSDHVYFEKYAERNRSVWKAETCPNDLYEDYKNENMAERLNYLCSVGAAAYKAVKTRETEDLDRNLAEIIPLTEQNMAAVFNKFYYDITENKNPRCLHDRNVYYIKNRETNKYLTLSGNSLIQEKNSSKLDQNQKFAIRVNDPNDGTFYLQPVSQDNKYLYINWAHDLKLQNYHDDSCDFKVAYSENGYYYITDKYNNFKRVLGSNTLNSKYIGAHHFDPDKLNQYWTFESCQKDTETYKNSHSNEFIERQKLGNSNSNNEKNGTTSVNISGNELVWLKEESDGISTWYGLDNRSGIFKTGSKFWVRWLTKTSSYEDWNKYYKLIDENHKNKIQENKLQIFLIGVTDPDGNEYTNLNSEIPIYIQVQNSDWDKSTIQSVFISDNNDEIVSNAGASGFNNTEHISYPENTSESDFIVLKLKHFSPYAIYDSLTSKEKWLMFSVIFFASAILILAFVLFGKLVIKKNK